MPKNSASGLLTEYMRRFLCRTWRTRPGSTELSAWPKALWRWEWARCGAPQDWLQACWRGRRLGACLLGTPRLVLADPRLERTVMAPSQGFAGRRLHIPTQPSSLISWCCVSAPRTAGARSRCCIILPRQCILTATMARAQACSCRCRYMTKARYESRIVKGASMWSTTTPGFAESVMLFTCVQSVSHRTHVFTIPARGQNKIG